MFYSLAIGRVHVIDEKNWLAQKNESYNCKQAHGGCRPAFVFSIAGQTGFRQSLRHLTQCNKRCCQKLRREVYDGIYLKLNWLIQENHCLGCVHVQPLLYGAKHPTLSKGNFPSLAHHLANCPQESCAQLRRALLLTVRQQIGLRGIPQG